MKNNNYICNELNNHNISYEIHDENNRKILFKHIAKNGKLRFVLITNDTARGAYACARKTIADAKWTKWTNFENIDDVINYIICNL